ncbi:hypothetical protein EB001_25025 [bacterium]|nr:hypothetical protein [bacterium]
MAYINVQIETSSIDTDDLINEIENRDYRVMMPGETDEDVEALHRTLDEIHNLYQAFLCWKDFSMKDSIFESDLKKFFEDTIDTKVL